MVLVKHILEGKGSEVWNISPETKIFDALKLMAEKNVGALLVMEGKEIEGIISERDYARKVILSGKSSKTCPVKEIMSNKVFYVNLNTSVEECMALMSEKHIRHLPVWEEKKVVGLVSIGDVVKATIAQKDFVIEQLGNYIMGKV